METVNFNAIILLILLICSFGVSALTKKYFGKIGLLSGFEFVVIGILLGDQFGIGFLSQVKMQPFIPLLSLLIGLFGFLYGLEVIRIKVKSESGQAGVYFHIVLLLIAITFFYPFVIQAISNLEGNDLNLFSNTKIASFFDSGKDTHLWKAASLAAMTIIASFEFVTRTLSQTRPPRLLASILTRIVASGETLAVFFFGAVFASAQALQLSSIRGWTISEWIIALIGIGVFCGLLFFLFLGKDDSPVKTYLATIGVVTLVSGMASAMGVSPLFLNFICGMTLALASPSAEKIASSLNAFRGAMAIMILFFAGVYLSEVSEFAIFLSFIYIALRLIALSLLTPFFNRFLFEKRFAPKSKRIFYYQDVLIVILPLDLVIRNISFAQDILLCALVAYLVFAYVGHNSLSDFIEDSREYYAEKKTNAVS